MGGGTGVAGSVGGGGTAGGSGRRQCCSPTCAASAYCDNGACKSRVTEFTLQDVGAKPRYIVTGADGNLWFTDALTTRSGASARAARSTSSSCRPCGSGLGGITLGPDGNVWFTEENGGKIGVITPNGMITEYPDHEHVGSSRSGSRPGPTESSGSPKRGANQIGISTPAGVISVKSVPTSDAQPVGIAKGPDGNCWFLEAIGKVGRITPTGAIIEFDIPTANANPVSIAAAPTGTSGSRKRTPTRSVESRPQEQ